MTNYPRIFAYCTASFTLGVIIYIVSGMFIPFTERPDWIGTLFLLGYALIYASVLRSFAGRYVRKTLTHYLVPYIMAPLMAAPSVVLGVLTSDFATTSGTVMYAVAVLAGSVAGAWLGIKKGHKMREDTLLRAQAEQAQQNA